MDDAESGHGDEAAAMVITQRGYKATLGPFITSKGRKT